MWKTFFNSCCVTRVVLINFMKKAFSRICLKIPGGSLILIKGFCNYFLTNTTASLILQIDVKHLIWKPYAYRLCVYKFRFLIPAFKKGCQAPFSNKIASRVLQPMLIPAMYTLVLFLSFWHLENLWHHSLRISIHVSIHHLFSTFLHNRVSLYSGIRQINT